MHNKDLPTIIIDEILLHFTKNEKIKLRGLNRHWKQIITPQVFNSLRPFCLYTGELKSYAIEYINRFGPLITEVCLDNFSNDFGEQLISLCPSISSFTLVNRFYGEHQSLPDEFYDFFKRLANIKELKINRELSSSVLKRLMACVTDLESLEFYAESLQEEDLVELFSDWEGPRLEKLSVVMGSITPELTKILSESCPNLKYYDFRIAHYSSDSIETLNDLIPSKKVSRATIEIPDTVVYDDILFDLSEHPNLTYLGLNVYIVQFHHESSWPQIKSLHLWGDFSSFPLMIDTLFPNLASLHLSCMDCTAQEYNAILKNATKLHNLSLSVGADVDTVFNLPKQMYDIKRFSLSLSSSASVSLFKWLSECLPQLRELSITSYDCEDIEKAFLSNPLEYLPIVRFYSKALYSSEFWASFTKACPNLQDLVLEFGSTKDKPEVLNSFPHLNFPPYYSLEKKIFG